MPTVTVNNDFYPDDTEIELPGLGSVMNHQSTEVTDTQIALYEATGNEWPKDGNLVINIEQTEGATASVENDDPFVRREDGSIDWEASDVPSDMVINSVPRVRDVKLSKTEALKLNKNTKVIAVEDSLEGEAN